MGNGYTEVMAIELKHGSNTTTPSETPTSSG